MNKAEKIHRATVAMAWAEGIETQFQSVYTKCPNSWGTILDRDDRMLFSDDYHVRIKPQPRVFWVLLHSTDIKGECIRSSDIHDERVPNDSISTGFTQFRMVEEDD